VHTGFRFQNLKEKDNLENLGVDGRIKSKVAPVYAIKACRGMGIGSII
jgi:hypothetical protein